MPLPLRAPNKIILSGIEKSTLINTYPVIDTGAKPGHLAELFNSSGTIAWRKNSSATAQCPMFIFDTQTGIHGLDEAYESGSLAYVRSLHTGMTLWGYLPSGQNITQCDPLQSNGNGEFKAATASTAAANVYRFQALETTGAVTVETSLRIQVI